MILVFFYNDQVLDSVTLENCNGNQIQVMETGGQGMANYLALNSSRTTAHHRIIQAMLSVTLRAMAVTNCKQCAAAFWQNGSW